MKNKRWIQQALKKSKSKRGTLHRQLGIPIDETIPNWKLQQIVFAPVGTYQLGIPQRITKLLKKRAQFALNIRG
jgi:hypothetical protein